MWKPETRTRHSRAGLRYPSDLSDAEWAVIEPLIPPGRRGGRRRSVDVRAVLNGVLYVLETGCQWRHLPKDLPPRWIRPRIGGFSFSRVPRPRSPFSRRRRGPGDGAGAQAFGHRLHVVFVQFQLLGNLPVRPVEAHGVQAEHRHP